jgi:hypothetical protein
VLVRSDVAGFVLGDPPSLMSIDPHTPGLSNAVTPGGYTIRALHETSTRPPQRRAPAPADISQVETGAPKPPSKE